MIKTEDLESPIRGSIYQGLLPILKEIYKDSRNPAYAPLLRFIGERKFLMKEVLILLFSERVSDTLTTERNLGSIAAKVVEWQAQYKEDSPSYLFGERILDAIHTEEIPTFTDLKPWIEANVIQNSSGRASSLPPDELQSFFAALGMKEAFSSALPKKAPFSEQALPLQLLGKVYEQVISYSNQSFLPVEEREFFHTLLLPHLERSIREQTASQASSLGKMEEKTNNSRFKGRGCFFSSGQETFAKRNPTESDQKFHPLSFRIPQYL